MPQLDSDSFTYSNGGLAAVSGGKWTDLSIGGAIPVVSNQLSGPTSECAAVITSWSGSTTLQYSEIVWTSGSFGGPTIFSSATNTFYLLDITPGGCQIYKVVGGAFTSLGSGGIPTAGHLYRLSMSVAGTLVATDNGSTIITVTGETSITSGKPGIRDWSTVLDSWAAGDFSVAGSADGVAGSILMTSGPTLYRAGRG